MLFKPESKDTRWPSRASRACCRGVLRRMVSLTITLVILGGLGYIGWLRIPARSRGQPRRPARDLDLPVPVLAATPRVQDVPVYLEGVGSRPRAQQRDRARPGRRQIDRGEFRRRPGRQERRRARRDRSRDLPGAIRSGRRQEGAGRGAARQPAARSRALSAAGGIQCRLEAASRYAEGRRRAAGGAGEGRSGRDRQCRRQRSATPRSLRRLSGRAGLRQVDQGNIIHASDTTGLVIITQLQPIAVQFSLPQQQIVRVNAAVCQGRAGRRCVRQ